MREDTELLLLIVLLLDCIVMVEEVIVIGIQATEITTIVPPLDVIGARREEEPHQGTEVGEVVLEAYLAALLVTVAGQEVVTA